MARLSYVVNTMATDDVAMPGARELADTVLTHFSENIPASAPEWFTFSGVWLSMCMQTTCACYLQVATPIDVQGGM